MTTFHDLTTAPNQLNLFKVWQPYYVAYAKAHGMTPEQIRERDRDPMLNKGGRAQPYIFWIDEKWRQFREANQLSKHEPISEEHRECFCNFIGAAYE